jgi:hypothetical protein
MLKYVTDLGERDHRSDILRWRATAVSSADDTKDRGFQHSAVACGLWAHVFFLLRTRLST